MNCSRGSTGGGKVAKIGYHAAVLTNFVVQVAARPSDISGRNVIQLVTDADCQNQTAEGLWSGALLYFCEADVQVTLLHPIIQDVTLDSSMSAVLVVARSAHVVVEGGSISGSNATTLLLAVDNARLSVHGLHAFGNGGKYGVIRTLLNATAAISNSTFGNNTPQFGSAMNVEGSSQVSVASSRFYNSR